MVARLWISSLLLVAPAFLLPGCAGKPVQNTQVAANGDPSAELTSLQDEISQAGNNQVNVLAPHAFWQADHALKEARALRDNGEEGSKVLQKISESRTHLDKAKQLAEVSRASLGDVPAARQDAIEAEAPKYFAKDFKSADSDLADVSSLVEKGNTRAASDRARDLRDRYRGLQLNAVLEKSLGKAKSLVSQAQREDASKWAPKTLSQTQARIAAAENAIRKDPKTTPANEQLSSEAEAQAQKLLEITRMAKTNRERPPEEVATQMSQLNNQVDELQKSKEAGQQMQSEQEKKISELAASKAMQDKLEAARATFSPEEADVYQQGNNLIIRLKSIGFPSGKAMIPSQDFATLNKVQTVISQLGAEKVTIEGHTDSIGSKKKNDKLSEDRAEAIRDYLVAGNTIPKEKVEAVGKGYEAPLASNKSREGRAMNRRVDIVIQPTASS